MTTVTKTFTDVGVSNVLTVPPGGSVLYSATESTFVGIATFERSRNGGASWETIETATDANMTGGTVKNESKGDEWFRFRVVQNGGDAVSGSLACSVADEVARPAGPTRKRSLVFNAAGQAKAGATAGFVVAAAADTALVTCPASQTAATLVLPLPALMLGGVITGFYLLGQIESAGNTVTLDADLRKHTAAAADVADASVATITQVSATADAKLNSANTLRTALSEVVQEGETFYLLLTATTGASTDIALQGVVIEIEEPIA